MGRKPTHPYNEKERQEEEMASVSDQDLSEVTGGSAGKSGRVLSPKDAAGYLQVLSERPGILERLEANNLSDADFDSIAKHFPSEFRFIRAAQIAHKMPAEEVRAIALMNG